MQTYFRAINDEKAILRFFSSYNDLSLEFYILQYLQDNPSLELLEVLFCYLSEQERLHISDDEIRQIIENQPYSLIMNSTSRYIEADGVNCRSDFDSVKDYATSHSLIIEFEGEYKGQNLAGDGSIVYPERIVQIYLSHTAKAFYFAKMFEEEINFF